MYEYIFPGLALDEAKAFAGVEPLHCSLFFAHFFLLFSSLKAIWCFVNRNPDSGAGYRPRGALPPGRQFPELRPSLAVSCDTARRAQKKAASLTRDRFTTARRYKSNKRNCILACATANGKCVFELRRLDRQLPSAIQHPGGSRLFYFLTLVPFPIACQAVVWPDKIVERISRKRSAGTVSERVHRLGSFDCPRLFLERR